jgi:hypothetical protein
MVASIFTEYHPRSYPHRFKVTIHCATIAGPTPSDQHVTEGWLKTKVQDRDDIIRAAAAEIMTERGIDLDEAMKLVDELRHLNGFKRTGGRGLYIDGNSAKAMLKEAVSVAVAADKIELRGWGTTKKFLTNYFPEHVFVEENEVYFMRDGQPVTAPDGINQRFVHTFRGASIQYEEYLQNVDLVFTVETDHDFSDDFWGYLWTTGEMQGIGASRSQGFGRFKVTQWDRAIPKKTHAAAKVAPMPPVDRPKKAAEANGDGEAPQPARGRKAAATKA